VKRLTLATLCALLIAVLVGASEPPFEAGYPYTFYYGSLHSHTTYSDGGHPNDSTCASSTTHLSTDATPPQAFSYARGMGLDFFAVTDHNHQFNDACPGCSAAQIVQRYHDGLASAGAATVNGSFVAMYGMEWGYISNPDAGFPNEGHVGVMESPKLFGWEPSACNHRLELLLRCVHQPERRRLPDHVPDGFEQPVAMGRHLLLLRDGSRRRR
jgi:hypothetical protein